MTAIMLRKASGQAVLPAQHMPTCPQAQHRSLSQCQRRALRLIDDVILKALLLASFLRCGVCCVCCTNNIEGRQSLQAKNAPQAHPPGPAAKATLLLLLLLLLLLYKLVQAAVDPLHGGQRRWRLQLLAGANLPPKQTARLSCDATQAEWQLSKQLCASYFEDQQLQGAQRTTLTFLPRIHALPPHTVQGLVAVKGVCRCVLPHPLEHNPADLQGQRGGARQQGAG